MKRSLLLGLLALALTGCSTMGSLAPGMDVFSINNRQSDPVDGDGARPCDQPPGGPTNERIRGGII